MNKILKYYLSFSDATSSEGKKYEDERAKYIGRSGLFISLPSPLISDKFQGFFYTFDDAGNIVSITTSSGNIKENDEEVIVKTKHSIYSFKKDYDLSIEEEGQLYEFAEAKMNPQPNINEENPEEKSENRGNRNKKKNREPKEEKSKNKETYIDKDNMEETAEKAEEANFSDEIPDSSDEGGGFDDLMAFLSEDE